MLDKLTKKEWDSGLNTIKYLLESNPDDPNDYISKMSKDILRVLILMFTCSIYNIEEFK